MTSLGAAGPHGSAFTEARISTIENGLMVEGEVGAEAGIFAVGANAKGTLQATANGVSMTGSAGYFADAGSVLGSASASSGWSSKIQKDPFYFEAGVYAEARAEGLEAEIRVLRQKAAEQEVSRQGRDVGMGQLQSAC